MAYDFTAMADGYGPAVDRSLETAALKRSSAVSERTRISRLFVTSLDWANCTVSAFS